MANATGECNLALIQEVLEVFPETTCKERKKHTMISDPQMESVGECIIPNRRSQSGVMTVHDCAYAGSKGAVFGPIKDMAYIPRGPIGCGQYSRTGWRDYCTGVSGVGSFGTPNFTSGFQERDTVSGGNKELTELIEEMEQPFPLTKGITIQSKCPVGLINDDISTMANVSSKALDKPVTPVRCEGFRSVLQSLGHHIVDDVVRDWALNNHGGQPLAGTPYDVAIIGDYNIGSDAWASCILLEEMGLCLVTQWPGGGTLVEMENTPFVKLNPVYCYRSMNYIVCHMEEKHQTPWMEYNFFGSTKVAESSRKTADQFDGIIRTNVEAVIIKYEGQIAAIIARYRSRLEGRRMLLYIGGLRSRHVTSTYENLGMEIIAAGYEFVHSDGYDRTLPDLKEGVLLFDDTSSYELETFVRALRPGLIGSGIKEKYIFQRMGMLLRQMHSWDYPGPYYGCDGFAIFARDIDMALNNPAWNELAAP